MSGYQKPKCDCGSFLCVTRSECWFVTRAITGAGEISDKVMKRNTSFDDCEYESKLYCLKCGKTYLSERDAKDRLVRGELIQ